MWARGEPADEAARQVDLCNRNICALARNFVAAGFTAVIDWVVPDRRQLDLYRELLTPAEVLLVVLAPGIATCRERNARRSLEQRFEFADYEGLDARMREELSGCGWWLDSSGFTAVATADRIVQNAREKALVR